MAQAKTKTTTTTTAKATVKPPRARPFIHVLDYGDFGAGKSTFLATFGKYDETRPVKVYMFDPPGGKEFPYLKVGEPQPPAVDGFGITYQDVLADNGSLAIRIMFCGESMLAGAEAYLRFEQEFDAMVQTAIEDGWKTVGLDTIDSFELAARKFEQYTLNPRSKDPRQWWGGSTDKCEESLCMRFANLRLNVVVLTHVNREKISIHGHNIQGPSSGPGRMDKNLGTYYPEIYHSYAIKHEGQRLYQLQTMSDEQWAAETHIDAPDPCYPDYESLWVNW